MPAINSDTQRQCKHTCVLLVYNLTFACMLSANAAMPSLYMCAYIQCGAKMAASLYMCACIQCGAKMVEYLHPGRGVAKTSDTQR